MKNTQNTTRLPLAAWLLPVLLLVGCPSAQDSHDGHNHGAGEEHDDAHAEESVDEHAGHDHDEENSK